MTQPVRLKVLPPVRGPTKAEAARAHAILREDHRGVAISGPLTEAERMAQAMLEYPADVERPRARGDCVDGPRPCPWVSCRHNLYLEPLGKNGARLDVDGSIKLPFPHLEPWEMPPGGSCALDVADRGGVTLDEVAGLMGVVRERIRQIEAKGLAKIRSKPGGLALYRDMLNGDGFDGVHSFSLGRRRAGAAE